MSGRAVRVALVHYRDDPASGGALRVGENLATHFDPARVDAHLVFAYGGAGPVSQRVGIPTHFIGATGPKDPRGWWRARRLLRELQPEIIHFVDGVVWLSLALLGLGSKRIYHLHGRPMSGEIVPFKNRLIQRWLSISTQAQICISHGSRRVCEEAGWIKPERAFVVHNAVDTTRYGTLLNKEASRERLRLPKDKLLVGLLARLVWWKGGTDLVQVLRRLPGRWHAVFAGDGPQRSDIEDFARRHGISHRIHMLGVQRDVLPIYSALDAYGFFSRYEPFGLVLAEAMAAGVPVFGLGGEGEYDEPENPLLVSENAVLVSRAKPHEPRAEEDPSVYDALADRLVEYGEHPERYAAMIQRAQNWVRERFDVKRQVAVVTAIYELLLDSQRLDNHRRSRVHSAM